MADWRAELDHQIDRMADEMRALRRHLHAHPEPSREEFETARTLSLALTGDGVPHRVVLAGRGLIAGPETPDETPRVAFRADHDALRLKDGKEASYRSRRDGVMHACGHDAHATMAFAAAVALHRCAEALPWPVPWRAIFQPAEEVGEGAAEMVAAGAVEGVASIVALHVAPELEVGRVAWRPGPMTALCQEIDLTLRGRGGHAARPHATIDPIAAAAQFVTLAYQALPRSVDARQASVVSFGSIRGGDSPNVIPERVEIRGTMRTLGRAAGAAVRDKLSRLARGLSEATGVELVLAFGRPLDAVINDPEVGAVCARAAADLLGPDRVEVIDLPSLGGEDFSAYLDHAPGCLLRLGTWSGVGPQHPLHSPFFDIDERALTIGAKLLARAAVLLARRGEEGPGRGGRGEP